MVASVPNDLFTDAPLHYQATPAGYLLYSVGMNKSDDHGIERGNGADDLAVFTASSTTRP